MFSEKNTSAPASRASLRVALIIDSNEARRSALAEALAATGYAPCSAATGREALRACREPKGAVSLVVASGDLPDMAALQLASLIDRIHPGVPVLFVNAAGGLPIPDHRREEWDCLDDPREVPSAAARLFQAQREAAA